MNNELKEFRPGIEVINMKLNNHPKGECKSRPFAYNHHFIDSTLIETCNYAVIVEYDDGEYEHAVDIGDLSIIDRRK